MDATYVEDVKDELRTLIAQAPKKGWKRFGRRIIDAIVSLTAANIVLMDIYRQTKAENQALHHLLNTVIAREGSLRFTREELEATSWDTRLAGFLVPYSSDVELRTSEKPLLLQQAPRWLQEAIEARPVPELVHHIDVLRPVFNPTDLYGDSVPNDQNEQ